MLAGLSKAQYYYLCLKAFSSALFEGEKVAWRERERQHECHNVRDANVLLRSLTPPPGVL